MMNLIFFALMATFVQGQVYPTGNLGVTGFSVQNIVMYLSVVLLVAITASRGQIGHARVPGLQYLFVIIFIVLVSVVMVDQFGSMPIDFMINARDAKSFLFEPFLLYFASFLLVRDHVHGMKYLAIFVVVVGAINLIWLLMAALNITPTSVNISAEYYVVRGRFAGFTGNSNKTTYLLCAFLPIQYFFLRYAKGKMGKLIYTTVILGTVITVLLSGSRGGLLGIGLVALLMARLWGDYKRLLVIPAILVSITISILLAAENSYMIQSLERIMLLASADLSTATSSRIAIWSNLFDVYSSNVRSILIGNGYGVSAFVGMGARAHNLYIMVLVEFGAIGLILWLVSLGRAVRYVKGLKLRDEKQVMLKGSVLISMYLLLVTWVFTTLIGVGELIGFLMGLSLAVLTVNPKRKRTLSHQTISSKRSIQ
jgi:O-antigen ligase